MLVKNSMRKICIVAHLNDLSGANKSLVDLVDLLKEHYEIIVVAPRKGLLCDELRRRKIKNKVIFSGTWVYKHDEKNIKKVVKRVGNIFGEVAFYMFFKKEKFDLIHFNSSVYGSGAEAAKMLKIPYTWHIRELAEENFNLSFFNKKKSIKLINGAKKIITISNFMKEKLKADFDEKKLQVVYNGLHPAWPQKHNNDNKYDLVMIGAIAKDKGQLDAIRAVSVLKKKGIEIKLYIVGAISNREYYELLQREIEDEIKNQIIFVGYLKDVSEYRKNKYIALVCSHAEAFGRVTIEAMNVGQIVIGTRTGATPEIIQDEENGYLYTSGNAEELALKIETVLKSESMDMLVQKGYKTVEEKFNIHNTVECINDIFKNLVE